MQTYYSNGKLLLTGEYVVLNGALALAIPTRFGQSLNVVSIPEKKIIWKSVDDQDKIWFEYELKLDQGILQSDQHGNDILKRLCQIINVAKQLNPNFLKGNAGYSIESKLTFPREWGLGSSSTLINNIAQWANADAFKLLKLTFGGSGYDIASAQHDFPITYQLKEPFDCSQNDKRFVNGVTFNPEFKECLYFVYLNKKQDTRDGIIHYRKNASNHSNEISEISKLTLKFIDCKQLDEFNNLVNQHESIISNLIKQEPIKSILFEDFNGSIKSLGAWGGDFILATSKEDPTPYFKARGFNTVIPFNKMILN